MAKSRRQIEPITPRKDKETNLGISRENNRHYVALATGEKKKPSVVGSAPPPPGPGGRLPADKLSARQKRRLRQKKRHQHWEKKKDAAAAAADLEATRARFEEDARAAQVLADRTDARAAAAPRRPTVPSGADCSSHPEVLAGPPRPQEPRA
ncbi:hypothetical protein N7455_007467 [Penicillium solitum]|uniref:uncharacterized protein n=1 Tax=Penicillium solitum TaxID=60172 RepID=UPI0017D0D055|nr:hypothetical protein HAV15_012799 [Penicillium sp. str. \